jgi:hypothetical protein
VRRLAPAQAAAAQARSSSTIGAWKYGTWIVLSGVFYSI